MNRPVEPTGVAVVPAQPKSLFLDPAIFEQAQRGAKMLAFSPLFPDHLRAGPDEVKIANAVLVLNIAHRMGEDPLTVGQNIYFVGGKPGWAASYMISRANKAGVFKGRIRWRFKVEGNHLVVTAYATLADTGEEVSAEASIEMARAEGWTKNAKYGSMPKQMLQYRSATLLVRLYCPEVMLGMSTMDEIEDVRAAEARDVTPEMKGITPPLEEPAEQPDAVLEPSPPKARRQGGGTGKQQDPRPKPSPAQDKAPPAERVDTAEHPPEEILSAIRQIVEALEEAGDMDQVEDVLAMFEAERAQIKEAFPNTYSDTIGRAFGEARTRITQASS